MAQTQKSNDLSKQIADDVKRNGLGSTAVQYSITEADAYGAFYKHYNAQGHVKQPKKGIWQSIVSAYEAVDKATDRVFDVMDETFGGSAINRATVDVRKNAAQTAYVLKETAKEVSAGIIGDAQQAGANLADLVSRSYGTQSAVAVTGDGRVYMTAVPQPGHGPKPTGNTGSVPKHPSAPAQHTGTHTDVPKAMPKQAPAPPAQSQAEVEVASALDKLAAGSELIIQPSKAGVPLDPEVKMDQEIEALKLLQTAKTERDHYKAQAEAADKKVADLDNKITELKNQYTESARQQGMKIEELDKKIKTAQPWYKQWAAVATIAGAALLSGVIGNSIGASGKDHAVTVAAQRAEAETADKVTKMYTPKLVQAEEAIRAEKDNAVALGAKAAEYRSKADDATVALNEEKKRVDAATTELNAVRSTVKKVSEDYAAAEKRAADVAAEASKLKQNLNSVLQNATIAQTTATDAEKKLNVLTAKYDAMTKQHEQMAQQYTALAKVAETIKTNETAYTAKLSEAEKRIAAVANEKRTLENELTTLRNDYAALKTQKAEAAAKVDQQVVQAAAAPVQVAKGPMLDAFVEGMTGPAGLPSTMQFKDYQVGAPKAATAPLKVPEVPKYETFKDTVAKGLGFANAKALEHYKAPKSEYKPAKSETAKVEPVKTDVKTAIVTPADTSVRVGDIIDGGMKPEAKKVQAEQAKRDAEAAKKAVEAAKKADEQRAEQARELAKKQAKEQREAAEKAAKQQRETAEKQKRDAEAAKKSAEAAEKQRKDDERKAAEAAKKADEQRTADAKKLADKQAREAAEAAKKTVKVAAPQAAKQANTVQPESYKTQGGLDVVYKPIDHMPHMLADMADAEASRTAGLNEHIAQIDKLYGKFDPKKVTDAETYARLMTESNYWRSAVQHGGDTLWGDAKRGQFEAMHYLTLELAHTLGINSGVLKGDAIAQSKQQLDNTALMYLHDESDTALANPDAKFAPSFTSLDQKVVSVSQLKDFAPIDMLAALSSATPKQAIEAAKALKGKKVKCLDDFAREARYLDGRLQKDTEKMRDKKLEFEHAFYDYVVAQFVNGAMPRNIDFSLLFTPPQPGTPAMNKVGDRLGEVATTATLFQQKYAPLKGEEKLNKRGVPTLLTDWAIEARNGAYLQIKASDFNITLRDLMKLHWAAYASKTALAGADTANGKSYELSDKFTDLLHDQPHDENKVNRIFLGHYGRERGLVQSEALMRVFKDGEWRGMAAILNEARKAVQTYFIIKAAGGFGNGGGSHNGGGVHGGQGGGGGIDGGGGSGLGGSQGGGGAIGGGL